LNAVIEHLTASLKDSSRATDSRTVMLRDVWITPKSGHFERFMPRTFSMFMTAILVPMLWRSNRAIVMMRRPSRGAVVVLGHRADMRKCKNKPIKRRRIKRFSIRGT
jgi:hypothetical protein